MKIFLLIKNNLLENFQFLLIKTSLLKKKISINHLFINYQKKKKKIYKRKWKNKSHNVIQNQVFKNKSLNILFHRDFHLIK